MLLPRKLFVLLFVTLATCLRAQIGAEEVDAEIPSEVRDKYLVILCEEREFSSAKQEAERVSMLSSVQFSMHGSV
jgi:hypothetical protein